MAKYTFARHLKNIALSIDIVNDNTLNTVEKSIEKYLEKIDVKFFEFLVPHKIGRNRTLGLKTVWHTGGEDWTEPLKDHDGNYFGQISYAFDKDEKLCVVSAEQGVRLKEAGGKYKNLWKNKVNDLDIPDYENLASDPTIASIMIPLKDSNGQKIGIFNYEFGSQFENSKHLHEELEMLTGAYCDLYLLNKARKTQIDNTHAAVNSLNNLAEFHNNFKKPKVFIAFAKETDQSVILSIKNVLEQFKDDISLYDNWDENKESRNINERIKDEIENCTYGICYFSKYSEGGDYRFKDSDNVVFEAGMIFGLARIADKGPSNWLPIREKEEVSGKPPFDFRAENMLLVDRTEDGDLDVLTFESELKKFIDKLLGANK